jgi:hypothetical protein
MITSWPLENGAQFHASSRVTPDRIPAIDFMSEGALKHFVLERWRRAYNAKAPELSRLKTEELYWSGHHYETAQDNRENPVINLCFALVETVWANLTEALPTPQIIPTRSGFGRQKAEDINEFAKWLMRANNFATPYLGNQHIKLKHGTCYYRVLVDPATGIAWPKMLSPYDFYKDPFCRDVDEMQYYFHAGPVPTRLLWDLYPGLRDQIKPDGLMSPSWDVMVRPYMDDSTVGGGAAMAGAVFPGFHFTKESEAVADTTTQLVPSPDVPSYADAETTFVLNMVTRDYSKMAVKYLGESVRPDQMDPGLYVRTPMVRSRAERSCPSGWRVISMTANGTLLEPGAPLDPCYLGLDLVVGRNYVHEGRFYGISELHNAIPVNRDYNRRRLLLNRSLEYEALPIMLMDEDAGTDIDDRAAEPGDAIKKRRGTQVEWLRYASMGAGQFELLKTSRSDFDTVSGVYDATYGRRPEGIEAGVAIRDLRNAALTRVRAKEAALTIELKTLLKKLMYATGRKAHRPIMFQASDGREISIRAEDLVMEYDMEFALHSGTAVSREIWEEKLKELYQLGIVDEQAVLEMSDFPMRGDLLQRLEQRRIIEMAMAQKEAAASPNSGNKPATAGSRR